MRNENDKKNLVLVDEDAVQGFTRWIPTLVVLSVVGGFFSLSWYAYHAGIESVKDDDLLVVEADKTPIKEKPADPGGMQFPNQDKTIFDTFNPAKRPAQNVERVLPAPEEPMPKDADMSETSTWVNAKLADKSGAKKEQIFGKQQNEEKSAAPSHQVITDIPAEDDASESFVAARDNTPPKESPAEATNKIAAVKAAEEKLATAKAEKEKLAAEAKEKAEAEKAAAAQAKAEAAKAAEEKSAAVKAEKEKLATEAKEKAEAAKAQKAKAEAEQAEKKPAATGGNGVVQLGAYRSEEEARDAWDKMHLKHRDLSDKTPTIVRADLGSKGVYYRLRITGLANAQSLCSTLSAKAQACIIPTGK